VESTPRDTPDRVEMAKHRDDLPPQLFIRIAGLDFEHRSPQLFIHRIAFIRKAGCTRQTDIFRERPQQMSLAIGETTVYTEKELLTIATVLQQLMPQSDPLYNLYSESSVSERYRKYGGIIRRVLPSSNSNHEGEIKAAVQTIGWNSIVPVLHSDEITKVRGYVVQWDPKLVDTEPISGRRKYNFSEKVVKISSDYVADQIRLKSNESSSMDLK
jgi:hypothetical protein